MTTETTVSTALDQQLQEAIALHTAGQLAEAEQGYRAILQSQPEHTQANYNLGVLLLQQGQVLDAKAFFLNALYLAPELEQCWLAYIEVLLQVGELHAASSVFSKAMLRLDRSEALLDMERRIGIFFAGQDAADGGTSLLEPDQKDLDALINLCASGHYNDAERPARELVRRFPYSAFAWKALGVVLVELKRPAEALVPMQCAVDFQSWDSEAHFNLGNVLKDLGRLEDAKSSYKNALALAPDMVGAHVNLGNVLHEQGLMNDAEISYRHALRFSPDSPSVGNLLGGLLSDMGRLEEAERVFSRIVSENPEYVKAANNLGVVLLEQGRISDAEVVFRKAIEIDSGFLELYSNLGVALRRQGRLVEAVSCFRKGLEVSHENVELQKRLGSGLWELGDSNGAIAAFRKALELDDGDFYIGERLGEALCAEGLLVEAEQQYRGFLEKDPYVSKYYYGLGVTLILMERLDEAEVALRKAIELDHECASYHVSLGACLFKMRRVVEAERCYQEALSIKSDDSNALANMAGALRELGRASEGFDILRRLSADNNSESWVYSNLLFGMTHDDGVDAEELYREHRAFGLKLEVFVPETFSHSNIKDEEKKLRIGFVSGDLGNHPVAFFIEPVWRCLDKERFEIYAYSQRVNEDGNTDILRKFVSCWRRVSTLSDRALADQIREDEIDILVDLSGHTALNRLSMFALKPAPIQVSWIGYPATTGLRAMDYYLVDRFCAPPGLLDSQFVEKLVRLPVAWAFQGSEGANVELSSPPVLGSGVFTYGSFNRASKITDCSVALWAKVLSKVPSARMLIGSVDEKITEERLIAKFLELGISADRLVFKPRLAVKEYLELHAEVDLLLDTVPYSGGTTTNHALWMGVPTLTLAGKTLPCRQGVALMNHVGLPEFVAESDDEYIEKAVSWSCKIPELTVIRAGMRVRIMSSDLRSPVRVARGLEAGLREMWRRWCRGEAPVSFEVQ